MSGEAWNPGEVPDSQGLSLLVVDVDTVLARAIGRTLSDDVARVCLAESVQQALFALNEHAFDALIVGFDDERGRSLLEARAHREPFPEILVHTRSLSSPAAEWVRERALGEILEKPAPVPVLLDWVRRIRRGREASSRSALVSGRQGAQRVVGESRAMAGLRELIRRVAGFPAMPVLIVGERGTGKRLIAQAIHEQASPGEPLLTLGCAESSSERLEVRLFGKDGAGGEAGLGVLELAQQGTAVLVDVGELPRLVQPKLLRALETKRFSPVDSNREIPLRARVVSTTAFPLREKEPALRKDLISCLSGYNIKAPPLRDHMEDIEQIFFHLLEDACTERDQAPPKLAEAACRILESCSWEGNVSQLKDFALRALSESTEGALTESQIRAALGRGSVGEQDEVGDSSSPLEGSLVGEGRPFASLDALERFVILQAYKESRGNLSRTARTLGVARSTLRDRLRRYGFS